jgi:hypothetical protein
MGGLPSPLEAVDIWRDIWFEEAHHSTAIEGNTLVRKQVEELLREGRAVGAKQLSEYMEVVGYADAARWVYRQAIQPSAWNSDELITLAEIRKIHHTALTPVWDVAPHPEANLEEAPGNLRQHEIEPFLSGMQPPTWALVDSEMRDGWPRRESLRPAAIPSQRTSRCFTAGSNRSIRFSTATVEPVA